MTIFRYDTQILTTFPELRAAVILVNGLDNLPSPESLQDQYLSQQQRTIEMIGEGPLSELPALAAWRAAFRRFGVNPTRYRSAPEALLRRLTKKGDIPSINALVDINNLVSIRYAIAVAAMDSRSIQGEVTVRFARGDEHFTPLGSASSEAPDPGEVIFVDEGDLVFARRWCWRQSDQSAARTDTCDVIITIEALHDTAEEDVHHAVEDMLDLLGAYVGGTTQLAYLSARKPEI